MPRQFALDVTAMVKAWRKPFYKAGTLSKHTRCLRCGRRRGELHRGQWRAYVHKCICCGRRKHVGQPCPVMLGSTFFFTRGWWKRHTGNSRPREKRTTRSDSRLASKAKRRKLQKTDGDKPSESNSKVDSGHGVHEEGELTEPRGAAYGKGSKRTHRRNLRRKATRKLKSLKLTSRLPLDADFGQLENHEKGYPQCAEASVNREPTPEWFSPVDVPGRATDPLDDADYGQLQDYEEGGPEWTEVTGNREGTTGCLSPGDGCGWSTGPAERYGRNMWNDPQGSAQWCLGRGGQNEVGHNFLNDFKPSPLKSRKDPFSFRYCGQRWIFLD